MAGADRSTARVRLSDLFRDPRLKAAFRRAERDDDGAFAFSLPSPTPLTDGAVVRPARALVLA